MTSDQPQVLSIPIPDLAATRKLAEWFSEHCLAPMTIGLQGTLGAGKTQWSRFFCEHQGVSPDIVTSPTYILLQRYSGRTSDIYHLDFYRLENSDQVWDLGVDELFEQPVIVLVEWFDKFPETLPADRIEIEFLHQARETRLARISATGRRSEEMITQYAQQ